MKLARRIFQVFAAVAVALVGIVAAFYGIEDRRGARAWNMCKHDLEARGEHLDAAAFIPPAVPDDKNLAMAPLFVRLYGYRVDPATQALTFPSPPTENALKKEVTSMPHGPAQGDDHPRSLGDWSTGQPLDLTGWQEYYRRRPDFPHAAQPQSPAEDVLLALTKFDPVLDELAQAAATRPRTRFPVNWTSAQPAMIALPHYNAFQCLTSTLRIRMAANLALGRNDAAMRDFALARRLIEVPATDPSLIAQLISETETGLMLLPVWEGLRTRHWSGPELEQIKTSLRGLDYLAGFQWTIRSERALFMCKMTDYFASHGGAVPVITDMENTKDDRSLKIIGAFLDHSPRGWYDQNKAIGCRYFQDQVIDTMDAKAHRVWLTKAKAGAEVARRMTMKPYTWLVRVMAPVFASVQIKAAAYQADVDHAVIACALEQFYLDHHAYPARLEELVPNYLDRVPPDVIDGQPTRYRVTPEGRYVLYSIGWNRRDDGGQIAWQKNGARRDNDQGDWVWQYEPLQPPDNIQRSK